jgi:hypothetical protein
VLTPFEIGGLLPKIIILMPIYNIYLLNAKIIKQTARVQKLPP